MNLYQTLFYSWATFFSLGEAQYIDDIPIRGDELHGAFVVSTIGNCQLDSIDPFNALVFNSNVLVKLFLLIITFHRNPMVSLRILIPKISNMETNLS